ncbi:Transcription factor bHLH041 like [Actinidia chinensis var. chinensis]|uniref:Transcription factor bHLH041 like n=1 Tax=Actinidia chinensis var. chinensis TaxID=1590841 RepID=A0A2R6R471_ACTCC|nr:Transcription factor bHLH041 like [Actinidia chinensis var. chinensis]
MDGFYKEEMNSQPSSSSGSLSRKLFDEYTQLVFPVQNGRVPGLAFKNNLPFMELKELDLQRLAFNQAQLQFYREARIKTAVFMGCMAGEIELGLSNDTQVNLEMEMEKLIPENFSKQAPLLPNPTYQNRPSSSSSSLRSLSMDSPERPPFLFNIPSISYPPDPPKEAPIEQASRPISSTSTIQLALNQIRNAPFPTPGIEDDAITKAMIAVLSSSPPPSSSSLSHHQPQQNLPPNYPVSAFKRYRSALAPSNPIRRPNMLKRAITFFRSLSLMRTQDRVQGSRPTTTQLHHMISERKRREKLNENFQALRSLLPPETKKDKASVLTGTTEYLASLKAQVAELTRRNRILEAQLLSKKEANEGASEPSNDRIRVQVTPVDESTSESRIIDLQVIVRAECDLLDLVIRLMEFLKDAQNVSVTSMEADTRMVESNSINRMTFRLTIEGDGWDESAFQEAVRRVVADVGN